MFNILKNRIAFTLAEVLITLGIIGIVAAMTIPTLINNSQNSGFKSGWKKEYSIATQIVTGMIGNNQMPFATPDDFVNEFANSLSYIKKCADSAAEGCWHADGQWYTLYGAAMSGGFFGNVNEPGFILKDGSYMVLVLQNSHYAASPPDQPAAYIFALNPYTVFGYVDVNGATKPNKMGYDIYGFHVYGNKIQPAGAPGSGYANQSTFCNRTQNGSVSLYGIGCSYMVITGQDY